jgi:hypothetical protein
MSEAPFACNLHGFTAAERAEHRRLAARLAESVTATHELADGYAFRFDSSRFSHRELVAWVTLERRCCPFFDIGFEWQRHGGPLVLSLKGRDGIKEFIRAEFPDNFR